MEKGSRLMAVTKPASRGNVASVPCLACAPRRSIWSWDRSGDQVISSEHAPEGSPARRSGPVVELLRWPAQATHRDELRREGRPCVWLLDGWELPPELGPFEDWVRVPVDERDLHARMQRLAGRAGGGSGSGAIGPGAVAVGDDGLLVFGGRRVVVPAVEAAILNRLGETPDRVVPRSELAQLAWSGDARSSRALDSRIHPLRGRLAPLGLAIHTIRGRGYLLAGTVARPEAVGET